MHSELWWLIGTRPKKVSSDSELRLPCSISTKDMPCGVARAILCNLLESDAAQWLVIHRGNGKQWLYASMHRVDRALYLKGSECDAIQSLALLGGQL